jgi:hypothetical protein
MAKTNIISTTTTHFSFIIGGEKHYRLVKGYLSMTKERIKTEETILATPLPDNTFKQNI